MVPWTGDVQNRHSLRGRVDSSCQGLGRFKGVPAPCPGFLSGVMAMLWREMVVTPLHTLKTPEWYTANGCPVWCA